MFDSHFYQFQYIFLMVDATRKEGRVDVSRLVTASMSFPTPTTVTNTLSISVHVTHS